MHQLRDRLGWRQAVGQQLEPQKRDDAPLGMAGREGGVQLAPRLRAFCLENGILLRPLGNTIYLMPPYCVDDDQLNHIFTTLAAAGDRFGVQA